MVEYEIAYLVSVTLSVVTLVLCALQYALKQKGYSLLPNIEVNGEELHGWRYALAFTVAVGAILGSYGIGYDVGTAILAHGTSVSAISDYAFIVLLIGLAVYERWFE